MDAATNFRLGVDERSKAKTETPKRPILQRIATGMSLVSLAVGFSILGALIIMKRDFAELNGVADGSSIATVGGITAGNRETTPIGNTRLPGSSPALRTRSSRRVPGAGSGIQTLSCKRVTLLSRSIGHKAPLPTMTSTSS
jgi:hypothetical protein